MPNPPQYLGSTITNVPGYTQSQTSSTTITPTVTGGIPVGSLLLLAAALEYDTSNNPRPASWLNLPTPGSWTPIFNYIVTTPLYVRLALMYKWADSNDASPNGQTYTITAGDGRFLYGTSNRRSGITVQVWNNVHPTTPIVFIQGGIYLAVTPQNTVYPPIRSSVPDVAFGYFWFQVSKSTIGESYATPPDVPGWTSATSYSYLKFYTRSQQGATVFPGVTFSVDAGTFNTGTANSLVIVPAGDPAYPSIPTPALTRSRAVPLAIAGPRLNEVTAAYKPVIRVY